MAVVAVTGMAVEARIARRAGLQAVVVAGAPERRTRTIADAVRNGADALISFGIAGALDPRLAPGSLLLPEAVHCEGGQIVPCDAGWRRRVLANLPVAPQEGAICGASDIVGDVRSKKHLFAGTGAVAVDLESGLVARAGVPFIVLRAIADPAWRALPPAALIALSDDGRPALGAVLRSVAAAPGQIPGLIRVALDTRHALAALARAAGFLQAARP